MKHLKKTILPAAGAVLLFTPGCGDDDEDSNDPLIIGEWEIVERDGQAVSEDYRISFQFQSNGDFQYCDETGSYCLNGEWEYTADNQVTAVYNYTSSVVTIEILKYVLDIESITEDRVEGDVTPSSFGYEGSTYEVVMEKQ